MHEHDPKESILTFRQRKRIKDVCHVMVDDDFNSKQMINL